MTKQSKLAAYYALTKPGVTYGNVITVVAGYLFAVAGDIDLQKLITVTLGMTLVIASACVINNYLDSDIDRRMERTKKRPSVTGNISRGHIRWFGSALFVFGFFILGVFTNFYTVVAATVGYITYVWLYGAWSKRRSVHGTVVGSISGAMPIVAGYFAGHEVLNGGALILFLILFFWQFPEFYSIAIYRRAEYTAARIPVMPVVKGVPYTINRIVLTTALFVMATLAVNVIGLAGWTYGLVMATLGGYWFALAVKGIQIPESEQDTWARKMFRVSMIAIVVLCVMLSIGRVLP